MKRIQLPILLRIDPVRNKLTLAAENQKNQKTASVTFSVPVTITSWWNMQNNVLGTWQELNAFYNAAPIQIVQKNFNLRSTQSFKLPKDFSVEVSGFYQSAALFSIYTINSFGALDLGLQKKFNDGKRTFRFSGTNVLNSLKFTPTVNRPEQNLVSLAKLQFSFPTYSITYTQSFGNSKVKGKRERTTGSEEERQRVQ
jgi:hypothetical protein